MSPERTSERQASRSWLNLVYWMGAIAQLRTRRANKLAQSLADNGSPTVPEAEGQDQEESLREARVLEREAAYKRFEREIPEPYVLGPQTYTDPNLLRPPGIEGPLTMSKEYRDTLDWLDDMDKLADSLPSPAPQADPAESKS